MIENLPVEQTVRVSPLQIGIQGPTPEEPYVTLVVTTALSVPSLHDGKVQVIPVPSTRYKIPIDGPNAVKLAETLKECGENCPAPSNLEVASNLEQIKKVAQEKEAMNKAMKKVN